MVQVQPWSPQSTEQVLSERPTVWDAAWHSTEIQKQLLPAPWGIRPVGELHPCQRQCAWTTWA